ncbi:MAG: hypothetical protein LBJ14_06545 [Desulfarculales bacterium]|jgi:hypothetical protein|nr:hypothetical protein [Desulfarculales bacterium]
MVNLQNRQFHRVPAKIKVFYCLETFEARQAMITDYEMWSAQAPELPEYLRRNFTELGTVHPSLQPLYRLLQWMDFKLDAVVYQMRVMNRGNVFTNYLVSNDISTTGFGFNYYIDYSLESRLLMALHLPDDPVRPLYVVGTLLRNQATPQPASAAERALEINSEQSLGAIRFEELSDIDEERISRFIFNFERKLKQKQEYAQAG